MVEVGDEYLSRFTRLSTCRHELKEGQATRFAAEPPSGRVPEHLVHSPLKSHERPILPRLLHPPLGVSPAKRTHRHCAAGAGVDGEHTSSPVFAGGLSCRSVALGDALPREGHAGSNALSSTRSIISTIRNVISLHELSGTSSRSPSLRRPPVPLRGPL